MTTGPSSAFGTEPNEQSTIQDAAGQAREKAQAIAGQAQEQAQQAAGQARSLVREQLDHRSSQAAEQITTQASDLRSVSDTLREQGKEGPAKAAGKLAEYAERVGGYLRDSDSDSLLADAEDLGRRQPWALAAGGVALGFAAARFLKASSARRYTSRSASSGGGRSPADDASPSPLDAGFPARVPGAAPPVPAPTGLPDSPVPLTTPLRTSGF
jgi:hypothetical protein